MRGLTLIETAVSMMLFWVVVILIFNLYPTSMLSLNKGLLKLRADGLAQTQLNGARALPFASLVVGSSTPSYNQDYDGTTFQWKREVAAVPGSDPNLVRELRITVTWSERGQARTSQRAVRVVNVTR